MATKMDAVVTLDSRYCSSDGLDLVRSDARLCNQVRISLYRFHWVL